MTTTTSAPAAMPRPRSLRLFDRFYLGALAIALVNAILAWEATRATIAASPQLSQLYGSWFQPVSVGVGLGLPLLLWFLVSRHRSGWARWGIVALFVLSLPGLLLALMGGTAMLDATGLLRLLAVAGQALALFFLFRPEARAWLGDDDGEQGEPA